MSEMKPTPGPWEAERIDGSNCFDIKCECGFFIATCHDGVRSESNAEANARLIAEAGTVFHNTGLSPVQLVEQRDELLAALMAYEAARQGLFSQTLSNGVFDAWGRCHDCTALNKAHLQARAALAKCEGVGNE